NSRPRFLSRASFVVFSSSSTCALGDQHSFPTRRSSDLLEEELQRRGAEHIDTVAVFARPIDGIAIEVPDGVTAEVVRTLDQVREDRKSTRLNSSHVKISYAVFCLKKKTTSAPQRPDCIL